MDNSDALTILAKKKQKQTTTTYKSSFTPPLIDDRHGLSVQMSSKANSSSEPFSATNVMKIHYFTVELKIVLV